MMFPRDRLVTAAMDGKLKIWDDNRNQVASELSAGDHKANWTLQQLGEDCFGSS
ncbi:hypothetical protein GQ44DRAFT_707799 [Phaeosphaeriaceae sp. PMI808]|nr:hypothetical protein GQ44DRAFT_707799 [Phaeosphaeriaceae sp. PMI808]